MKELTDLENLEIEWMLTWDTIEYICEKENIDIDDFIENLDNYEEQKCFLMLIYNLEKQSELQDKIDLLMLN